MVTLIPGGECCELRRKQDGFGAISGCDSEFVASDGQSSVLRFPHSGCGEFW
ncbi:hypothetical protein TSMEX_011401 [Taenia solium]|eukprot:TsM_000415300 transcript=TsM_000415300 gene=TsM_000415300